MKNKLPRLVLEELKANPNISPEMMEAARQRILQNSEVKKHKVFLKIKKDFTPSNANK